MDKEKVYIIIASQEFISANHLNLWKEIANQIDDSIIVVNIPSDLLISIIKRKFIRISEYLQGPLKISDNLTVIRPFFLVRHDILPEFLYSCITIQFWTNIKRVDPNIDNKIVRMIVYDPAWVKILRRSHNNMKIGYYLFDEVRKIANTNKIDKKSYRLDEYACKKSDVIFTMTHVLADSRREYNPNIYVIGNGSVYYSDYVCPKNKFNNSIAFIGNIRNWIDKDMFKELIEKRQDVLFALVGPVEDNMKTYLNDLLNKYDNTIYYGRVSKDRMTRVYRMFDGIIIPYKKNEFIQATRPIKIVEAVLAGVPVVTIPMNGYRENQFIRFASSVKEFSEQIDYLLTNPINRESPEYLEFVDNNTWSKKAKDIIKLLS